MGVRSRIGITVSPQKPADRASHPSLGLDLKRGFTLVELLVVIGIIAVLTAILLPALMRARAAANSIKCQSNLHQMILAARMYCDADHGMFPPAHYLDSNENPVNSVSGLPALLGKYTSNVPQLILCPSDETPIDLLATYSVLWKLALDMPRYTSYQCNFAIFVDDLGASTPPPPMNIAKLQHFTSDQIAFYDGGVSSANNGPWEVVQARHPGPTFNAAFIDGHVQPIHATLAPGRVPSGYSTLPIYSVDRGNRPIWYAGADDIPTQGRGSQGIPEPGFGAICWGLVEWR